MLVQRVTRLETEVLGQTQPNLDQKTAPAEEYKSAAIVVESAAKNKRKRNKKNKANRKVKAEEEDIDSFLESRIKDTNTNMRCEILDGAR